MDRPTDTENLRPKLEKVLLQHQLKAKDVKERGSNIHVFDNGMFTCSKSECIEERMGRGYSWRSAYSWLTFDLRELVVKKEWRMKCKYCSNLAL